MNKSPIANIASELERMPERVEDARKAIEDWRHDTMRLVRKYPGRSVLGALALGFVVAKIARHI